MLASLATALAAYYLFVDELPQLSLWGETLFLAVALMPAVFALVWLVLPLRAARGLGLLALAFGALAVVLEAGGVETPANFAKLAAMTAVGFWFLTFFDRLS